MKIELHTIATYEGKEYELEELMNIILEDNNKLHSIIKEAREYNEHLIRDAKYHLNDGHLKKMKKILDKVEEKNNE